MDNNLLIIEQFVLTMTSLSSLLKCLAMQEKIWLKFILRVRRWHRILTTTRYNSKIMLENNQNFLLWKPFSKNYFNN